MKIQEAKALFAQSFANDQAARTVKRASGAGTLRGAMAGIVVPPKSEGASPTILAAKCPRLDQARFRGVEASANADAQVIFAAGFGHENYMSGQFKRSGLPVVDCTEKGPCEVSYIGSPTHHFEEDGISGAEGTAFVLKEQGLRAAVYGANWQGTPDFLLWDGTKLHGIEAKSQVSNYGVAKSIISGWPQRKHILQCANYMAILGMDEWLLCVGHYFFAQADGEKYKPQVRWFRVFIEPVTGEFCVENEAGTVHVLDFGVAAVLSYQKLILDCEAKDQLAPRPTWKELFPKMRAYEECNYCPANMLNECNRADVGKLSYAEWLERLSKKEK